MDHAPFSAKGSDVRPQVGFDAPHIPQGEAMGFAQFWRAVRAVQDEYGLAALPPDVDMRGTMIGGVDHHAQGVEAQDRRHGNKTIINPSDWEYANAILRRAMMDELAWRAWKAKLIFVPLSVYEAAKRKDPVKLRVALPAADPPDNPSKNPVANAGMSCKRPPDAGHWILHDFIFRIPRTVVR
jgi:hypothetical protein